MHRAAVWREVAGDKPYVSFIHLDLDENPEARLERHRFGCKVGRKGLIAELEAMRAAGVAHIGLHLRHNRRPLDETLEELGTLRTLYMPLSSCPMACAQHFKGLTRSCICMSESLTSLIGQPAWLAPTWAIAATVRAATGSL